MADEYDRQQNRKIKHFEKYIKDAIGQTIKDDWSPNFKMPSNFYNKLTEQRNMYLLRNGVNWAGKTITVDDGYPGAVRRWVWDYHGSAHRVVGSDTLLDDDGKEILTGHYEWQVTIDVGTAGRLGKSFDSELRKGGKMAIDGAVSFGFWNADHIEFFRVGDSVGNPAFVPIWDRFNGNELKAGIRFWYIRSSTNQDTLYATLYEADGVTQYVWESGNGEVLTEKAAYIKTFTENRIEGRNNVQMSNHKRLPIIPLWANQQHMSAIERLQDYIDQYDITLNGIANDLSDEIIFWVLSGAAGFDEASRSQFVEKIRKHHAADVPPDSEVQPVPVNPPIDGKSALLQRLEHDIYKSYSALNIDEVKAGAVTATQIRAAYEDLDLAVDEYEYCILDFLDQLLDLLGIEDTPTFTRSPLVNVNEQIQTLLQAAQYLGDDYVTKKTLELFGDGDKFEAVQNAKQAEQMSRLQIAPADEDEDEESEEEAE